MFLFLFISLKLFFSAFNKRNDLHLVQLANVLTKYMLVERREMFRNSFFESLGSLIEQSALHCHVQK